MYFDDALPINKFRSLFPSLIAVQMLCIALIAQASDHNLYLPSYLHTLQLFSKSQAYIHTH